jgi:hypothetical protein
MTESTRSSCSMIISEGLRCPRTSSNQQSTSGIVNDDIEIFTHDTVLSVLGYFTVVIKTIYGYSGDSHKLLSYKNVVYVERVRNTSPSHFTMKVLFCALLCDLGTLTMFLGKLRSN